MVGPGRSVKLSLQLLKHKIYQLAPIFKIICRPITMAGIIVGRSEEWDSPIVMNEPVCDI